MAAAAEQATPQAPSISTLAREALREQNGLVAPSIGVVVERLRNDAVLLRAVVEGAIRDAIAYRAQSAIRHDRANLIRQVTGENRANVVALAGGIAASLLDMPLAGGIKLRSCDRAFVQHEADRFNGLAKDCGRKARFLEFIAQSIPDGKVVGDVISDARATELWSEAQ